MGVIPSHLFKPFLHGIKRLVGCRFSQVRRHVIDTTHIDHRKTQNPRYGFISKFKVLKECPDMAVTIPASGWDRFTRLTSMLISGPHLRNVINRCFATWNQISKARLAHPCALRKRESSCYLKEYRRSDFFVTAECINSRCCTDW